MRFNARHQRCGHLFQGRFRAELVEADEYARWLIWYMHLNPVRPRKKAAPIPAGGAGQLARYRWSSHRAYAGRVREPDWLDTSWLRYWGKNRGGARRAYRREMAVAFGLACQRRSAKVRGQLALCGDQMWERVREMVAEKKGGEERAWTERESAETRQQQVRRLVEREASRAVKLWARVKLGGERGWSWRRKLVTGTAVA